MLVYSVYRIIVSSLSFSPSIDKLCTFKCPEISPPRLVCKLFAGETNVIRYISNFQ